MHHKRLTMHEWARCRGGCVSRKFCVRHGAACRARGSHQPDNLWRVAERVSTER